MYRRVPSWACDKYGEHVGKLLASVVSRASWRNENR